MGLDSDPRQLGRANVEWMVVRSPIHHYHLFNEKNGTEKFSSENEDSRSVQANPKRQFFSKILDSFKDGFHCDGFLILFNAIHHKMYLSSPPPSPFNQTRGSRSISTNQSNPKPEPDMHSNDRIQSKTDLSSRRVQPFSISFTPFKKRGNLLNFRK